MWIWICIMYMDMDIDFNINIYVIVNIDAVLPLDNRLVRQWQRSEPRSLQRSLPFQMLHRKSQSALQQKYPYHSNQALYSSSFNVKTHILTTPQKCFGIRIRSYPYKKRPPGSGYRFIKKIKIGSKTKRIRNTAHKMKYKKIKNMVEVSEINRNQ